LRHYRIGSVLTNTHYLYKQIENFIDLYNKAYSDIFVTTVYEKNLLGSAGTLKANKSFFEDEEDFVIIYGDNLTTINYEKLISYHKEKGGVVTIAAYVEPHPETKGIIVFDESKKISKFIEKPKPEQVVSNYANAGVYVVNKEIFNHLSLLKEGVLDFGFHVFPNLLENNVPMYVYEMSEFLLDIGTLESYTKSQELVKHLHFYDQGE
jgi:NDP-sugar pyrophosphorylase family protein